MTKKKSNELNEIKKESEEIHKANKILIISIIIIFIGLGLSLFLMYRALHTEVTESYNYNGFKFEKIGGIWFTQIQGIDGQLFDIPFYNDPKSVKNITIEQKALDILAHYQQNKGKVYITLNPELPSKVVLGTIEFARILGKRYHMANMDVESAFDEEPLNYVKNESRPIITCENVTNTTGVIWVKQGKNNRVYTNDNYCIIVEFTNKDESVRVSDRFAYSLVGIMGTDENKK